MKKVVYTAEAPEPIGPYSQAILVDNTLYCSGQIPVNPKTGMVVEGGIEEQTLQCIKNIENVLISAGYSFDDVVKTTCFLADMADFAKFNEIYSKYFVSKPARSCVAVKQLPKNVLVEVEVLAVKV